MTESFYETTDHKLIFDQIPSSPHVSPKENRKEEEDHHIRNSLDDASGSGEGQRELLHLVGYVAVARVMQWMFQRVLQILDGTANKAKGEDGHALVGNDDISDAATAGDISESSLASIVEEAGYLDLRRGAANNPEVCICSGTLIMCCSTRGLNAFLFFFDT